MGLPFRKKKPEDPLHPNKPSSSSFMQQRLPACQLEISASTLLPVFLFLGVIFIPLGIVFLTASAKVLEMAVDYTKCQKYTCDASYKKASNTGIKCCSVLFRLEKEFAGQVYMYYQLDNFYQNHRVYVRSKDDEQLNGNLKKDLATTCVAPHRFKSIKNGNETVVKKIAPCGAIANSIFNDTFKLVYVQVGPGIDVTFNSKDLTWPNEKGNKYRNPSLENVVNSTMKSAYSDFTSPPNWKKAIYELNPYDETDNANLNTALIIWMRTATFPKFRKLYKKILHAGAHVGKGLPKGNYRMDIQYNFPVEGFEGRKHFVLTTAGWLGGKGSFLGTCFLVAGLIFLVFGFAFMVMHMKARTSSITRVTAIE